MGEKLAIFIPDRDPPTRLGRWSKVSVNMVDQIHLFYELIPPGNFPFGEWEDHLQKRMQRFRMGLQLQRQVAGITHRTCCFSFQNYISGRKSTSAPETYKVFTEVS